MNDVDLWHAIQCQAAAWSTTPVFKSFAAVLPDNVSGRLAGDSETLQMLNASGGRLDARPLRSCSAINMLWGQVPGPPNLSEGMAEWLRDAGRVEEAHRQSVAWLRSRLPNYPILRVPQLARGTHFTTPEFTWRLGWRRADLSNGLQFLPAPTGTGRLLGTSQAGGEELDRTARAVLAALEQTEEWGGFVESSKCLQPQDMEELSAATMTLRSRLKPDLIDAFEPQFAVRRDEFRENAVSETLETLSGAAKKYAVAFDSLDSLIERATSDVFGQLAAYGLPAIHEKVADIDIAENRTVHFTVSGAGFPRLGSIMFVRDEMIHDALILTGITITDDRATGTVFRLRGEMLKGSGAAWMA